MFLRYLIWGIFPFAILAQGPVTYPYSKRQIETQSFQGTFISDPYRWLEDLSSSDTNRWIEKQETLSSKYLAKLPHRDKIERRLSELHEYVRFGLPKKAGAYYLFNVDSGFANRPQLAKAKSLLEDSHVFFDLHEWEANGEVSVYNYVPDPKGGLVAANISWAGSKWHEWRLIDVGSGNELADRVKWVGRESISWTADGRGFFYIRFPSASFSTVSTNQASIYFHLLGTKQDADVVVYETSKASEELKTVTTEDGKYLLVQVFDRENSQTKMFYKEIGSLVFDTERAFRRAKTKVLFSKLDGPIKFVNSDDDLLYFLSYVKSANGELISLRVGQNWDDATTVVPASNLKIVDVSAAGGRFFVNRLKDLQSQVEVLSAEGRSMGFVKNPGYGTLAGFEGSSKAKEVFFTYTNFHFPELIYRFDLATQEVTQPFSRELKFKPRDIYTKLEFFEGIDGKMVPMLITSKKGMHKNNSRPAMLMARGCLGVDVSPRFSISSLIWVEEGGVLAVPAIRDTQSGVNPWQRKIMAASDILRAESYLEKNQKVAKSNTVLFAEGCSSITALSAVFQKADVFSAVLLDTPIGDLFRYSEYEGGSHWISEFGLASDDLNAEARAQISPVHAAATNASLPPILISSGIRNFDISPIHSFKLSAKLQTLPKQGAVLLRVDRGISYGEFKSDKQQISLALDQLSFALSSVNRLSPATNSKQLVASREERERAVAPKKVKSKKKKILN